jgi:hypothetical protein
VAAGALLLNDAVKLRRTCGPIEKYLLSFWWGTDVRSDIAEADAFCGSNSLRLRYVDSFDTTLRGGEAGYFALGVLEVR